MSVIIETTLGEFTVDLFYQDCPQICKNFIQLCKQKFYNNAIVSEIQKDLLFKVINPHFPQGKTYNSQVIRDEINPTLNHSQAGYLTTSNIGPHLNNSNFCVTLDAIPRFNGFHSVFGVISENESILDTLNAQLINPDNSPMKKIRIKHTIIIFDPFEEDVLEGYESPLEERSDFEQDRDIEEIKKETQKLQAKTWSNMLEMIQDIPDADLKLPENYLFVCKLNECTKEEDLEVIFGRFGGIRSCEIVRDWKTGDSLQYAFIEFETDKACEEGIYFYKAYWKMENALIDQRRIHVDFSQSSRKLWPKYMKRMKENKLQQMNEQPQLKNQSRKDHQKYSMVYESENNQQNNQKQIQEIQEKHLKQRNTSRDRIISQSDNTKKKSRDRRSRDRKSRDRKSKHKTSKDRRSRDRKSRDRKSKEKKQKGRRSRDKLSRDKLSRERRSIDKNQRMKLKKSRERKISSSDDSF